jgi:hypothetical protein
MATIYEGSLLGTLTVSTSPNTGTASWTDHSATVSNVSLTRGGEEPYVGVFNTDVGSGTITLVNNSATIEPGYWVRVATTGGNVWAGFISDVREDVRVLGQKTYNVKTLIVLDWVAWLGQIRQSSFLADQVLIAGVSRSFRPSALNLSLGFSAITMTVNNSYSGGGFIGSAPYYNDISWANMLDLTCNSVSGYYWHATKNAPTNGTTGRTGLAKFSNTAISSSGIVFTDGTHTGTPSNLCRYSDATVSKETSSIVNTLIYNNTNGVYEYDFGLSDTTSVNAYGTRSAVIDTNAVWVTSTAEPEAVNLSTVPSFEGMDFEGSSVVNFYTSIEQPALDAGGAWAAYSGTNALRAYNVAGTGTTTSQGWDERIPVKAGTTYYSFAYAATTGTTSIRARARIDWYNEANTLLSTSLGSFVSCSSFKTWYKVSLSATAPTNAVYGRITVNFDRNGSTFPATTKLWVDGVYFGRTNEANYFDGNTADTTTRIYYWTGSENNSTSNVEKNVLNTNGNTFLTANATPRKAPKTIVWNAQDNIALVDNLELYTTVVVWYGGQYWTQVVTGISHDITTNGDGTDRWLVTLTLRPSTGT